MVTGASYSATGIHQHPICVAHDHLGRDWKVQASTTDDLIK